MQQRGIFHIGEFLVEVICDPVGIQTQDLQNRKLIANSYYCAVGQPIGNTCNSLLNHI